ncbi:MAG: hypothetical protein ACOVOT_08385 [Rubrivivax sp.]|jgi:hypothetical protein|nr:hypothetical protein [Rubrivivax sp.]
MMIKHARVLPRAVSLMGAIALTIALAGCQTAAKLVGQLGAQPAARTDAGTQGGAQRRPTTAGQVAVEPNAQAIKSNRNAQMENHFRRQAEADRRLSLEEGNASSDRRFPDMILRHGVGQSSGFFSESERSLTLGGSNSATRTVWLPWMPWGKGQYLGNAILCQYGGSEGLNRGILLWHVARPKIDPSLPAEQIYKGDIRTLAADVVVKGNCPGTWGEALTLVWGEDAWDRLRNSPEAKKSLIEAEQVARMNLEQRQRWEAQKEEAWAKLSEKERCLIRMGLSDPNAKRTPLGEFWAGLCEGK